MDADASKVTAAQFKQIVNERIPFAAMLGIEVDAISAQQATLRAVHRDEFLRPGGSIAGPIMMGLADAAFYAVIMANIGAVELAVTTDISFHFLRKPPPADLIAVATVLKLGKRLVVCEGKLYSKALPRDQVVAHATGTYSLPQA